mmetsp:Transcript_73906/g.175902  ORF Transcript_73906/g.175902 Transcript_73906/m.175902 type:complete len:207 (-) Transcript_73906:212-832(-)
MFSVRCKQSPSTGIDIPSATPPPARAADATAAVMPHMTKRRPPGPAGSARRQASSPASPVPVSAVAASVVPLEMSVGPHALHGKCSTPSPLGPKRPRVPWPPHVEQKANLPRTLGPAVRARLRAVMRLQTVAVHPTSLEFSAGSCGGLLKGPTSAVTSAGPSASAWSRRERCSGERPRAIVRLLPGVRKGGGCEGARGISSSGAIS